eukprot:1860537-Pyramimonas_sp.AAC.1
MCWVPTCFANARLIPAATLLAPASDRISRRSWLRDLSEKSIECSAWATARMIETPRLNMSAGVGQASRNRSENNENNRRSRVSSHRSHSVRTTSTMNTAGPTFAAQSARAWTQPIVTRMPWTSAADLRCKNMTTATGGGGDAREERNIA